MAKLLSAAIKTSSSQVEPFLTGCSRLLQRKCACGGASGPTGDCAECRRKGRESFAPVEAPPIVHDVLGSPGRPLDPANRTLMETRFGHDFSRVRVHTDEKAAESARAVDALAYTVGRDVVFGTGQYWLGTAVGQRLLAHELAHVMQQESISSGAVTASASLQVGPGRDRFEQEAEAMAAMFAAPEIGLAPQLRQSRSMVRRQLDFTTEQKRLTQPEQQRSGGTLPYREATELAECIRIMGEKNAAYCRQEVLGEQPQLSTLEIVRQGGIGKSFISTDTITLTARAINPLPGQTPPTSFNWTVQGVSPNAGNGNPHSGINQSSFTFRPNPTKRPRTGSRRPNDPIQYRVEATASGHLGTFNLTQDESDLIRQEYLDLGPTAPPDRGDIVAPTLATYNTGNYTLIVDGGMDNALTNTETEFQALTPAGAAPAINVSSGYRNPRRNVAAGSHFPVGSRHVWGRALDLTVAGANATLWARLRLAGANAGNNSICERGPTHVPCNDPTVDHVHIQW